ncbi:hypothetical protein ACJIZ3_022274 [Penstemon smallii]|uniref:Scarecrow-like protein 8 n=1 Tax=Penstemon smallii TaxID=265156 RepID=A0ABD3TMM2_9LAMI
MSSGFSGGTPDFFSADAGGRSTAIPTIMNNNSYNTNLNHPQQQLSLRSPLSGVLTNTNSQIRRPEFIGKRSLADFQQQSLGFYLRNVKPRPYYQQQASPISPLSPVDFSPVPTVSSISNSGNSRYGRFPILQQHRPQPLNLAQNRGCVNSTSSQEEEKKIMDHRLQELEKQLLGDEEENGEDTVSVVTNSEWSHTIQNLLNPNQKPISSSPTSSTSSCSSTLASPPLPCPKQSLIEAAVSISDGKPEAATEILTRLLHLSNTIGSSEQRLTAYMVSALKSRVNAVDFPPAVSELYSKEHALSTQMLYDVSPCFKLGFMAANLSILEATTEQGFDKIHVLDFDIGQGGQYDHLLHALAAAKKGNENKSSSAAAVELKITAFCDSISGEDEKLKNIGDRLKLLAQKIGVSLNFHVKNLNFIDLTLEKLDVQSDEALVVNFAFKLYKLPDESVTTENLRDELLRRVKSLSPIVMTVVEQEMNANTSPLATRVRDACEYYGAIFDSLDSTISRESPERVRIEEGLSRKMCNSVACEGRERVERCEVFGKWRARFSMAGFKARSMSQLTADSLRSKLNSGTRGNPGFTVCEQTGGICFGWMGRTLAVASAWC